MIAYKKNSAKNLNLSFPAVLLGFNCSHSYSTYHFVECSKPVCEHIPAEVHLSLSVIVPSLYPLQTLPRFCFCLIQDRVSHHTWNRRVQEMSAESRNDWTTLCCRHASCIHNTAFTERERANSCSCSGFTFSSLQTPTSGCQGKEHLPVASVHWHTAPWQVGPCGLAALPTGHFSFLAEFWSWWCKRNLTSDERETLLLTGRHMWQMATILH